MKDYTDPFEETYKERDKRILAMLKSMVIEVITYCLKHNEPLPRFSRDQIGNYVGCSKDNIRRMELNSLRRMRRRLSQLTRWWLKKQKYKNLLMSQISMP